MVVFLQWRARLVSRSSQYRCLVASTTRMRNNLSTSVLDNNASSNEQIMEFKKSFEIDKKIREITVMIQMPLQYWPILFNQICIVGNFSHISLSTPLSPLTSGHHCPIWLLKPSLDQALTSTRYPSRPKLVLLPESDPVYFSKYQGVGFSPRGCNPSLIHLLLSID